MRATAPALFFRGSKWMKDKDARSLAVRAIALEIPVYEISTGGQRTRILEIEEVEE